MSELKLNSVAKLVLNAVIEGGASDTYSEFVARQLPDDKFLSLVYATVHFQDHEIGAFARNIGVTQLELQHAFHVIQLIYCNSPLELD